MPVTTLHGSSPHTRGAPATSGAKTACASDHPRIRGEHGEGPVDGVQDPGSSPHTRGAHGPGRYGPDRRGIIPAYAGSTWLLGLLAGLRRDHPRIRGEHAARITPQTLAGGSSPHTRGAQRRPLLRRPPARIIPAYAGSTPASCPPCTPHADHPRIRGEHPTIRALGERKIGSSPHTRGALEVGLVESRLRGIIPAYAGSTASRRTSVRWRSDHPRIRGEHSQDKESAMDRSGSSPHTRGALRIGKEEGRVGGIIPAYAGSTARRAAGRTARPDHPRIRGEHAATICSRTNWTGSSPHTRGARSPKSPARS